MAPSSSSPAPSISASPKPPPKPCRSGATTASSPTSSGSSAATAPTSSFWSSAAAAQDGHGHHQVSAILGKEAFDAAGDPARFPEQLRYVEPWQATRIVHACGISAAPGGRGCSRRRAARARRSPQLPPAGQVETGAFNPVLGYSYRGTRRAEPQHAPQPGYRRHAAARRFHRRIRSAGRPARALRPVRWHRYHLEPLARRRAGRTHPGRGHSRRSSRSTRKRSSRCS